MEGTVEMIYVLTIITLGYSAYTDRRTLTVHPVISIGMLAVWLCYRIAHLIRSMDIFGADLDEVGITFMISMTSFMIALFFAHSFGLGAADAIWFMTVTLSLGPHGLIVIASALAGFIGYLFVLKEKGRETPLIPFIFGSFLAYLITGYINRLLVMSQ